MLLAALRQFLATLEDADLKVRHLPCISPISPLHLPCISPISPLHLPCISPMSPLHLPYISPTAQAEAEAAAAAEAERLQQARYRRDTGEI